MIYYVNYQTFHNLSSWKEIPLKLSIELDTATLGDNETLLRIAHALNPASVGVLGVSKIEDEEPGHLELTPAAHEYLHAIRRTGADLEHGKTIIFAAPAVAMSNLSDMHKHEPDHSGSIGGAEAVTAAIAVAEHPQNNSDQLPGTVFASLSDLVPENILAAEMPCVDQAGPVLAAGLRQPEPAAVEPPKRRAGRKSAAEKAAENPDVAAIREAEKQAMMEAINAIKPVQPAAAAPAPLPTPGAMPGTGSPLPMPAAVAPPALPVAAAPSLPPLPGMIAPTAAAPSLPPLPTASAGSVLPPLPTASYIAPALPTAAAAQTPAIPGAALAMPVIPMDGSVMSEADFITVVRISSQKSTGAAFKILTKYNWFDPKQVPDANRAAVAAEILSEANKAAA